MAATVIVTAKETVEYRVEMTEAEYDKFLADPEAVWSIMSDREYDSREATEYEVAGHQVKNYRKEPAAA